MAKSANSAERRERLAVALRDNLKRRKARARALAGEEARTKTGDQTNTQPGAPDLPAAGPNKAAKKS